MAIRIAVSVAVGLLGLSATLLLNGCAERSVVQADSREIALTEGEGLNYGPCFSPDGKLIAYSSISHAGFILVGVQAATERGTASVVFYALAYTFLVLGRALPAFVVPKWWAIVT